MRRLLVPAAVLVLLIGGISIVFLVGSEPLRPRGEPEQAPAGGPLVRLAPRLRGLAAGVDGEVAARMLVEQAMESVAGSPRVPVLEALGHPDWGAQWAGLLAVPRYGPADAALADALGPVLSAPSRDVRRTAAQAAAYIAAEFEQLEPALEKLALDDEPDVRAAALQTLARRTGRGAALWRLFADALGDEHGPVRTAAAQGLSRIELQEALPPEEIDHARAALRPALKDGLPSVRMYAAMALGRAGPRAAADVPALIALLDDDSPLVRGTVATALGGIGPDAIGALEARLAEDDGPRAASLLWALRLMGKPALSAMRRAAEHPVRVVRLLAALKLWELGDGVQTALAVHKEALASGEVTALRVAARQLARMGTEAAEATEALRALTSHEDETVRAAVAAALERIAPDSDGR